MIVKLPPAYDVSHWNIILSWGQVSPKPVLVICKATEGNFYSDSTFKTNMMGLKANGIHRGAYHFHRKANTAESQATRFLDFVRGVLEPNDFIALDVEEGGETAAQIIAWIDAVEKVYPDNLILIYSSAMFLNAIPVTAIQTQRLKQYPVWTAGYPDNPDDYSSVHSSYVPDQTRWGPVWLWQYSGNGRVIGIDGDVDCNWIAPVLLEVLRIDGGTMLHYGTVKVLTNIRTSPPGGMYQDIGDLYMGDEVIADEVRISGTSPWWHLTNWKRGGEVRTLPGPECWAYGTNITEHAAPSLPSGDAVEIVFTENGVTKRYKMTGTWEVN